MHVPYRIYYLLFLFVLSGCVTSLPQNEVDTHESKQLWKQRYDQLSTLQNWSLKGKIGVKTGKRGGSATLKWDHAPQIQDIELYGPFGGGRVLIQETPAGAVLKDTKGLIIEDNTASDVLFTRLGWHIPFNELIYWARGIPDSTATDLSINHLGQLTQFTQGNWHVEYQSYTEYDDLTLPRKFILTALPGTIEVYTDDGEYLGDDLNVKVILKRWWDIE